MSLLENRKHLNKYVNIQLIIDLNLFISSEMGRN